jgi:Lhr-like helicase
LNETIKKILSYIITGIVCLLIGAAITGYTIYQYSEKRIANAQRLIDTTKKQLSDSENANRGLKEKLDNANIIIGKFENAVNGSSIIVGNLDGSITESQNINDRAIQIIARYIVTK